MNERSAARPFAKAAEGFEPVENYAGRDLAEAFEGFDAAVASLLEGKPGVYVLDATAFYSLAKDLGELECKVLEVIDKWAEAAAVAAGGLLVYVGGQRLESPVEPDRSLGLDFCPDCMSFCIWHSAEQAAAGAAAPEHERAATLVDRWYEAFDIRKYQIRVTIAGDGSSEVEVLPYAHE